MAAVLLVVALVAFELPGDVTDDVFVVVGKFDDSVDVLLFPPLHASKNVPNIVNNIK